MRDLLFSCSDGLSAPEAQIRRCGLYLEPAGNGSGLYLQPAGDGCGLYLQPAVKTTFYSSFFFICDTAKSHARAVNAI